jgi:hypothetical protein
MTQRLSTDDLIARLAAAPPPPALRPARVGLAMSGLTAVGLVAAMMLAGLVPRMAPLAAMADPHIAAKTLLPLAVAILALAAATRSARPGTVPRGWLTALPALVALGLFAGAARGLPGDRVLPAVMGYSAALCLTAVTAVSLAPIVAGLALMRLGAPTRPALSGGLVGLTAGGLSAAGYALFCTQDSPLFYVTWYGLGIMSAGLVGAVAGARVLRW